MIIHKGPEILKGTVRLPPSKSLYNRLLLIRALCEKPFDLSPPPLANDNILLGHMLESNGDEWDLEDAGTPLRFLMAYAALKKKQVYITGNARMKQRPVGPLAEVLSALGARVEFHEKAGYPPFSISGGRLQGGKVHLDASASSQFASALMLTAPLIPGGLEIQLRGSAVSLPYIHMTAAVMQQFGVPVNIGNGLISVPEGKYAPPSSLIKVESDWSAASYWFGLCALAGGTSLLLEGLVYPSPQGDSRLYELASCLGLSVEYRDHSIFLSERGSADTPATLDMKDQPDLVPALAVTLAALGKKVLFKGLDHLAIKESDRTAVLAEHLQKVKVVFRKEAEGWLLDGSGFKPVSLLSVDPHNDHRIAMAFAMLSCLMPVEIQQAECVRKSYPGFFEQLTGIGFIVGQ